MRTLILFYFSLLNITVYGLETNNFKRRSELLDNPKQGLINLFILNDFVNNGIRKAMEGSNNAIKKSERGSCLVDIKRKPPIFMKRVEEILNGSIVQGAIEEFAEDNESIHKVPYFDSFFKSLSNEKTLYEAGWEVYKLSSSINLNGHIIGTDKLSHFFGGSLAPYTNAFRHGEGNIKGLKQSNNTENEMFGLDMSGVKSYADMAANVSGMKFWKNLVSKKSSGVFSYIVCNPQSGLYEVNRDFDFSNYVSDLWDEGLNCNVFHKTPYPYKKKKMPKNVEKTTPQVSYENYLKDQGMSCPVDKGFCIKEAKKPCATYLLSAVCFQMNEIQANEYCPDYDLFVLSKQNKSNYQFKRSKHSNSSSAVISK